MKALPNFLTVIRIGLIPILIMSFYLEGTIGIWVAAGIFTFASVTDYFDGFLARTLNAHSDFGRVLDPIADKMLVAATLMMLVHLEKAPIIPAILILCREILVSGLREYLAEFKVSIPVTNLAKFKTAIQFVAIVILILGDRATGLNHITLIGKVAIWIAAGLTLVTGYAHCKEGFNKLI